MAQSKNAKQMHKRQVALAEEQFEIYKGFIVKEFVDKFAGSYQTAEGLKKIWRSIFIYTPKCENFLIEKTIIFLGCALSTNNRDFQSPVFFKTLIGKISEYLAVYIEKKGESRNSCSQRLRDIFTKTGHVQSRTNEYIKQNQKEWALRQRKQKEAKEIHANLSKKRMIIVCQEINIKDVQR